MDRLSNNITATFEVLGILHYFSNKSTVSFVDQCKDILIEASCIEDKIGHSKMKN